jgi:hypothetical protein
VPAGQEEFVLHGPADEQLRYRIDGLVTVFPGELYAARVVTA